MEKSKINLVTLYFNFIYAQLIMHKYMQVALSQTPIICS